MISSRKDRDYEELLETIERIKEIAREGIPIVVEGKKDRASLESLGVEGNYIVLNGSKKELPYDEVAQYKKVLILTDFDREGKKVAKSLVKNLQSLGINPLLDERNYFYRKFGRKVKQVEGIVSYLRKYTQEGSYNGHL
ncbi:MAG: toprim domain-containing protein [Candidatus Asgardarchaeia archaeon]